MIKFNWIITDDLSSITINEFDLEWNEIYGYFEMYLNDRILGYCPKRKILSDEEGGEAILYWLFHLLKGIYYINNNKEYEFQLLSMNLAKLVFKKNNVFEIRLVSVGTGLTEWREKVDFYDFYKEVLDNVKKLLRYIEVSNKEILNAKRIKELSSIYYALKEVYKK